MGPQGVLKPRLGPCRCPHPFSSGLAARAASRSPFGHAAAQHAAPTRAACDLQRREGARLFARASSAAVEVASTAPSHPSTPGPAAGAQTPKQGSVKTTPTFQEAIARLQEYWAQHGCIVWLPHNTEVGAGTMNPATFLRVQGPEPWNVAYVEPSIRPDDSRYGDNPNRLQRHTQFQVILKPDPGNSQELYLGSLEALGIDTRAHDVRFVEDNWESPVLGAWGLGWEVWLDGMEVTQFTYFQQAGGRTLDAPAVEITYGLERILMALQGVANFRDIAYNRAVTYGELFLQNEYEMSVYNLDEADVEQQRLRFDLFQAEAKRLLDRRLPIPAYDHLLKLSQTFNILDARGAVGVTERANCFAAMRALAREVTALWISRREELSHPLGLVPAPEQPSPQVAALPADLASAAPQPFVLEVGTEELPPDDVQAALEQLREAVPALLQRLRLGHGEVRIEGTPRRLAVQVADLAAAQEPQESQVRGPPKKAAYGPDGAPSKALEGFCRKNAVSPADVYISADAKGVEYVWASVKDAGQPTAQVLVDELPKLLAGITFKKSMKWRGDTAFSRPVRWLLALHGATVVPLVWAGLRAGATTRLLRNSAQPAAAVRDAAEYAATLERDRIVLDTTARREAIWAKVADMAASMGGHVPRESTAELLAEVANLVEAPVVVAGQFEARFLALPKEVLVMVMRKHQRYFPVLAAASADAPLLPRFITVANGAVDPAVVVAGNEAVLRARFEDATFFYNEDLKTTLDELRPKLAGTLFQKDLGSLLDKAVRVEALVAPLAAATGLEAAHPGVTSVAQRAAHLAKADLASATVMEMTALAGTMARHYAAKQGLDPAVCEAIFEAALPRQAGDLLPRSPAGILASAADRLDSLVGLFAAGCAPTASADPYGLRRAAYGMLQALVANNVPLSLRAAVEAAAALQPVTVPAAQQTAVLEYIGGRLEQLIIEQGVQAEVVRAVLAERADNPALAASTAKALQSAWEAGEAGPLRAAMASFSRPTRIVRGKAVDPSWAVDPALLELEEEKALHAAYLQARSALDSSTATIDQFLAAAQPLAAPIAAYFEKVFVMCEDEAVRCNRLAFLRDLAGLTRGLVDLSQLPGF